MSSYSKISCPNCKNVLIGWHRSYMTIGNPFIDCSVCKTKVRCSHANEWESMNLFVKIYYYFIFYSQGVLLGSMAILFGGMIFDSIFQTSFFINEGNPTPIHIFLIIFFGILGLLWRHKNFQEEIKKSKERTRDPFYRKILNIKD